MVVELTKGARFNLSKQSDLKKVAIALGWEFNNPAQSYEIDASVFMLGSDGKLPHEKYFVFYNNLQSFDSSVLQSTPKKEQQEKAENKAMYGVRLEKINPDIQEIIFVGTIDEVPEKNANFSMIKNAFIKICHLDNGSEIARYDLKENFFQETAIEFGRLYRNKGEWKFQAVGQGYNTGLQSFVDKYHVENIQSTANTSAISPSLDNSQPVINDSSVESEPKKPRKKKRRKTPKNNNQVSAVKRKIPINLLAGLGVLILGIGAGATALIKSQEASLHQAKILIDDREKFRISTDINFLKNVEESLKKSIANLDTIPNLPGFAYQQAQSDLANLRPTMVSVEQNINAVQSLETAQKLALEAAILVKNPPHTVEVWRDSQSKWQQAIALLQAIPTDASVYISAQQKLSNYLANQTVISQRFATAQKAVTFSNQGSMKLEKADYRGAIADFNQAVNINQNLPQAYLGLGISHSKLGNSQQAIQNYNQALKFNGNLADAYFSRGQAYYEIGNNQKAIADYEQTIRLNPNYALAYLERGAIRYQIGSKPQGFQDFRQAAELFSKEGDTKNYQLAQTLLNKFQEPTSPSPEPVKCDYARNIDSLGRPCGVHLNIPVRTRKTSLPNPYTSDTNLQKNTSKQEISPSNSDSSSSRPRRSRRSRR
ncbi:TerD family protein [Kamptonema sp. UHCC 0994]|uniref:TerD family protein n=1 Tax=Kamptonema sp. UHCC 0994 TaxID=3031329 RepID=UPI0023B9392C|nr:TerD family protein [Kamptonema sp. UHCC 0994]MDF0554072.1 TerD family protein [Kamptonema sp. UHCC 0994]